MKDATRIYMQEISGILKAETKESVPNCSSCGTSLVKIYMGSGKFQNWCEKCEVFS